MTVVFDEVIVSVEAPPTESQQDQTVEQPVSRDDDAEKIINRVEIQQRWAHRLLAE